MSFRGPFAGLRGYTRMIFQVGTSTWAVTERQALHKRHSAEETRSIYRQGANGIKEHVALFTDFADGVDFCSSALPRVMPGCWGLTCWSLPGGSLEAPLRGAVLPQDGAICPKLRNLADTFHTVNLKQKSEYSKNISCFWMCLNKARLLAESRRKRGKNSV